MSKSNTKKQRVLVALRDPRGVSPWYAAFYLANLRLAATINSLKKEGYVISSEKENGVDKFGEKTRYTRYRLVQEKV
jgi:hypothetical protein